VNFTSDLVSMTRMTKFKSEMVKYHGKERSQYINATLTLQARLHIVLASRVLLKILIICVVFTPKKKNVRPGPLRGNSSPFVGL